MGSSSPVGVANISVDVHDRQQAHRLDTNHLAELLAATLATQHGDRLAEVGLAFVDEAEMTTLNELHMASSGPTDVLAFPIDGVHADASGPSDQPLMFGDIVICPQVAARAPQSLENEVALLVVHGALHLVGHDHAELDETAVMKALEVQMLDRFHRT